jgi:hydrophobe/amphiphile efflux-3 (HAE3) family protein
MPLPRTFERIVRAAVRRPALLVALAAALAAGGGLLALGLRPNAGTDTLVNRDSETFKATERYHQRFGEDAIVVLVRGDLTQLLLTSDLARLLGLEGCLSGNIPRQITNPPGGPRGPCVALSRQGAVQVVYGPGTFINEAVRQIQDQFAAQSAAEAARERRAMTAARELAAAQGQSRAQQELLAGQARQLVRTEFLRDTLRLALQYGLRGIPQLNDPGFVSQLVFDPARGPTTPKARFAYLFPTSHSALVQVRLKPGLSQSERERAIALVRQATRLPAFRLRNGEQYTVTGAPVVVEGLTHRLSHSIAILLVAALLVMAATLLVVFRSPARRPARLLPLAIALGACGLLFGGMRLVGASLTMASIAVLPVLVGLAVDYAIQFQSRFDEVKDAPRAAALGAPTIAAAGLATAAGFLVLLLSPVPMVRGFGALLVVGIVLAFACALTAGFAAMTLLARVGPGPTRVGEALGASARGAAELLAPAGRRLRELALALGAIDAAKGVAAGARRASSAALREATTRPERVLGIAVAVAFLGFVLDTQTRVVSDVQKLMPQSLPELRDLNTLQRATGVSGEIDVTVQARDLTDPRVIAWMTGYQSRLLQRFHYTEKRGCDRAQLCPALSLPDLFRDRGAQLDSTRVRALLDAVPPYFSQAVITPDRTLATMAFGIRLMPLDRQKDVIDTMRSQLHPPPGVHAELVGLPVMAAEANAQVSSAWRRLLTVLAGLAAVSLVLLAVYRRAERALVPLVPIALAGGWSALVLFAVRIPLNPMSVTLGALVIAITTEFSVLLSERYRQERAGGLDPRAALARTYASTGAAVIASGATAIAGFAVLAVSDIRMLRDFGIVTVLDLAVSLIGVLVVLPAVLVLAERGELLELPGRALERARAAWPARRRAPAA